MVDRLHQLTLPGVLDEHARSFADKIAVVFGSERYSYGELAGRVRRLADALEQAGVGSGDRILWLGQNGHGVLEGILAAAQLGAMFCPANWRQSGAEMAFVIDDLRPKIIFWQDEEIGEAVRDARARAGFRDAQWLQIDAAGAGSYAGFLASGSPAPVERRIDPDIGVLIIYTAAFEGHPNGAVLSQTAILWQDLVLQRTDELTSQSVYLNSGPLFHVGTLRITLATFHVGGTNVFVRRTNPAELCETIVREGCTAGFLFGKIAQDIVELNRDGRYDLKKIRSISLFPDWDTMVTVVPSHLPGKHMGYGQTEAMGLITLSYYGEPAMIGAHGRTIPVCQLRLVDDDGQDVPEGQVGEIALRGPTIMLGYYNRPDINRQRQRNGWHHTNDLGRRETDGSISFVGPKTQMIKCGVENIYPAEVEGCLRDHPAVADCAVIGVPDPQFVQTVKALIQLRPGMSAKPAEIIEHCKSRIASYKKPRAVEFVPAIARTAMGTIDYRALDAAHGGGGYPGAATPPT